MYAPIPGTKTKYYPLTGGDSKRGIVAFEARELEGRGDLLTVVIDELLYCGIHP